LIATAFSFPRDSLPFGSLPHVSKPAATNKTLVIIIGNLRGGEKAWKTLYHHVLDVNDADLALLIGRSLHRTSSLYNRAKYVWEVDEYEDWADAIDLINGTSWRERVPRYLYNESSILGGANLFGYRGSGAVIFMFRWFLSQKIREHNLTSIYDRFVVTRSDHYYLCHHNLSFLDPQFMWLPKSQNFGGVTDRHLVVNSSLLLPALDILPQFLEHPEDYASFASFKVGNPERLIHFRWKKIGIRELVKRFDRMMFTCAESSDPTRWQTKSDLMVPEGVYLKYTKEYNLSHVTCQGRVDDHG
jgi:hypothetical protein